MITYEALHGTKTENKIAMLIDADNVSHRNIKEMTDELARFS